MTVTNLRVPTFTAMILGPALPMIGKVGPMPVPRLGWQPLILVDGIFNQTIPSSLPDGYAFGPDSYILPTLISGPEPKSYAGTVCFGPYNNDTFSIHLPQGSCWFWWPLYPDSDNPEEMLDMLGTTWIIQCYNLIKLPIGAPIE